MSRRATQRLHATPLLIAAATMLVLAGCSRAPAAPKILSQDGTQATTGTDGATTPGSSMASPGASPKPGTSTSGPSTITPGTGPGATTPGTGPGGGAGNPNAPDPTYADTKTKLFTPKENRIGITSNQITMCAHAALTYGAAFNTTADDFNVYFSALNDAGGIFGRKVVVTYENDNYTAADAVKAATACAAKNPFILIGGIGFDQIPAVRNFVEQRHILYFHHTATLRGTAGQKYSFSELPTVERMGEAYAQLAHLKFQGKRIGIIERDSPNWSPGTDSFKALAKTYGLNIVKDVKVVDKQANYTDAILAMKNAKAEVVFGWENALNATELITQAKRQLYSPNWLFFGVNLMSQTLKDDALTPPLIGAVMYTPYSYGDYTGPFAPYANDMKLFEAQYKKYRPNTKLKGVGGDLLFLNWVGQKALAQQLQMCGKDCTRNRFIDTIKSYNMTPTTSACTIDFVHSDGYHGSNRLNFIEAYKSPSGQVNFRNFKSCVGP